MTARGPLVATRATVLGLLLGVLLATPADADRVGTYNVERGHPVAAHVTMVLRDARRYRLDVLALEETQDYARALIRAAPPAGYRTIRRGDRSRNVLLVKASDRVTGRGWFNPGGWWWTARGFRLPAIGCVWARVNGVNYVALHAPVRAWVARRFVGPARRRDAYRRLVDRLIVFARFHRARPLVILGDWNASPVMRGLWSPNYLRRRIGARFARPYRGTGHGEIDFGIVRGARVSAVRVRPNLLVARSDHRLVTMRVPAS